MATVSERTAPASRQGAVPSFQFSTTGAAAPFDVWRSLLVVLFDGSMSKASGSTGFKADLLVQHFGTFLLCRSQADGGRFRRDALRLAWDDLDHIVISCVLSGGIALGGPVKRLRPGDVTVLDLSSPANFAAAPGDGMHLIVPRTALPAAVVPVAPLPCRVFARDTGTATFLRGVIEALFQASRYLTAIEAIALGAYFPELLGWCLGTAPGAPPPVTKADLGKRLRRYIEDNLNRRDLTSARLAREIGVSRSQLYRQFEASGGVETYIRRRRLRRSLQTLSDPRRADLRIGDIAFEMGFADEAHFSRLFRQSFGQSPRELRAAARHAVDGSPRGPFALSAREGSFADWLLTLGKD